MCGSSQSALAMFTTSQGHLREATTATNSPAYRSGRHCSDSQVSQPQHNLLHAANTATAYLTCTTCQPGLTVQPLLLQQQPKPSLPADCINLNKGHNTDAISLDAAVTAVAPLPSPGCRHCSCYPSCCPQGRPCSEAQGSHTPNQRPGWPGEAAAGRCAA